MQSLEFCRARSSMQSKWQEGMKRTQLIILSRHQTTQESLCWQLFNTPNSALIGWCKATSVSIVTWRRQLVCEQGTIRECSATTVTKQNHYLWNSGTDRHVHEHMCAHAHVSKHSPCPPPPHPNGCDIERSSFNLQGEMQAEPQKMK